MRGRRIFERSATVLLLTALCEFLHHPNTFYQPPPINRDAQTVIEIFSNLHG
uniref:Bm1375 n=1 Tax=Brugia malayi TaxID=6279 RepID=A0A1I9G2W6_BRUMA|nr:Bm1375 [Brugia malayi]